MAIMAEDETVPKKKNALIPLIGAIVLLTVVGGAGGWFTGKLLVPASAPAQAEKPAAEGEGAGGEHGAAAAAVPPMNVIELAAILTNIGYPSDTVVRLQVGLVFDGAPDQAIADGVNENILNYLRTVPLQQLQGPRGFTYLKGDLQEIAGLRSKGRVTKVLIRTFVVE